MASGNDAEPDRPALKLPTPDKFPIFPYPTPYSIQVDLMRHLYTAIEERKVAIVESPTGTVRFVSCPWEEIWLNLSCLSLQGKTLSLLSAAFTWLDDDKERARQGQLEALAGGDGTSLFSCLLSDVGGVFMQGGEQGRIGCWSRRRSVSSGSSRTSSAIWRSS